ncbi:MAG: hypothetical protein ACK46J_05895, partial [Burkholderiales bacterium]
GTELGSTAWGQFLGGDVDFLMRPGLKLMPDCVISYTRDCDAPLSQTRAVIPSLTVYRVQRVTGR